MVDKRTYILKKYVLLDGFPMATFPKDEILSILILLSDNQVSDSKQWTQLQILCEMIALVLKRVLPSNHLLFSRVFPCLITMSSSLFSTAWFLLNLPFSKWNAVEHISNMWVNAYRQFCVYLRIFFITVYIQKYISAYAHFCKHSCLCT